MGTGPLILSLHRIAAVCLVLAAVCTQATAQPTAACTPAAGLAAVAVDPAQPAVVIDAAEHISADGSAARVRLPDAAETRPGAVFVERRYRVPIDAAAQSLYLSAVFGHLRVWLNGEMLLDTITTGGRRNGVRRREMRLARRQAAVARRARMPSTRARLTPKSPRPTREAERTCTTPAAGSTQNSTSSTKRIIAVVNWA
jgi:hypothetical protein